MAHSVVSGLEAIGGELRKAQAAHQRAEERDYTGNNPKGIDREVRAQRDARDSLSYWEWALSAAGRAAEAGIGFEIRVGPGEYKLAFAAGPDGKEWPVSPTSFDGRLETLSDPVAYAAFLVSHDIGRRAEPVKLADFCAMLPGARFRGFRAALLDRNGYATEDGLTPSGMASGYFVELSGAYGPYYLLTPAGLDWAYRRYLDGRLPTASGTIPQAVPELEDRIAKSAEDRLRAAAPASPDGN